MPPLVLDVVLLFRFVFSDDDGNPGWGITVVRSVGIVMVTMQMRNILFYCDWTLGQTALEAKQNDVLYNRSDVEKFPRNKNARCLPPKSIGPHILVPCLWPSKNLPFTPRVYSGQGVRYELARTS